MPADVSKESTFGKYCARGIVLTFTLKPAFVHMDAKALQTFSSFTHRLFGQSSVNANPSG